MAGQISLSEQVNSNLWATRLTYLGRENRNKVDVPVIDSNRSRRDAPIDHVDAPGTIAAGIRRQEQHRLRDLLR
jgi:hypothetical protein